jgi:hypothetical protein
MKQLFATAVFIILVLAACKSKKQASVSPEVITDAQLTAVQARFPDATKAELQKGYAVYTGPCTKCHGSKDVNAYTEPKLLEIVDNMSKKAGISPEEKQGLIRFAVGVRATSKK